MPKSTYISITNHKGQREFRITASTKQVITFAFALLALTIILGTFFINRHLEQLKQDVASSQQELRSSQKAFAQSQNEFLQSQSEFQKSKSDADEARHTQELLTDALAQKESDLIEMNRRLDGLENMLGIQDQIDPNSAPYEQLNIVSMNTVTRKTLLSLIPNGVPMRYKRISSPFGYRKHPITKKYTQHNGMDFTCKIGEKIYAPANAVVETTQKSKKGYGNLVRLNHLFGFKTYYAHLSTINVKSGQFINRGDVLGTCGNTGRSTGPHLHYEVRFLYRALNPKPFLTWNFKNFDSLFAKEKHVNWKALVDMINELIAVPIQQLANHNVEIPDKLAQKSKTISNASDILDTP